MRKRHVVLRLAVISMGVAVLASTATFKCPEASCGPTCAPSSLLFVVTSFLVGGVLLFSRRHR